MIDRRELLLGGAMLVGAAGAFALTPRRRIEYLGSSKLDAIVPRKVGPWIEQPSEAFVLPKTPNSLSAQLYSDQIARLYVAPNNVPVMVVMAYGNLQSDQLQLHRPEICYAAVGFQISASSRNDLLLGGAAVLPVRELVATSDARIEPICYWTRIGDALPTSGNEQRWVKLQQEIDGMIPDGILVRLSTVATPSPEVFAALRDFGTALVRSVAAVNRPVLIGPTLTAGMRAARV